MHFREHARALSSYGPNTLPPFSHATSQYELVKLEDDHYSVSPPSRTAPARLLRGAPAGEGEWGGPLWSVEADEHPGAQHSSHTTSAFSHYPPALHTGHGAQQTAAVAHWPYSSDR